ncbi:MAG: 4'-phosphopantetheinyl transferase superfamily protein [Gammaproteobacteria bacterium]|jgi:4'-phosphopantetheinyl transferase|nr:4'-phosphopantetheinyl transferase superfamily protein [Gammaproteobacteria bacterium]MBT3859158.1 4'-phosphopantetheinyl transferase superfamily protein [Gammaproteobacteria bacterium]MBT3987158.1 4'-phosphopantetheinyl transferase superfamily protein [Gammaproteobacteria bacterium]MBT4255101.1 4'-phosphopantetheinyl transferase superfamily protein [Gammaproteobacteria bacterium]MBT4580577.1 4'-phosphopantetheinyl transferase superfamily protein [Gammaproteobacteria bacterium]
MRLERNEIHLWHLDQDDFDLKDLESHCLAWLNEVELERFQRYQFERNRKQLLLGRYLLRTVLSRYHPAIDPDQWLFITNEYGKPEIAPQQQKEGLFFNISHSGSRLVLAISRFSSIGIDVEFSAKKRRVEKIAHRFFSATEAGSMLALKEGNWLSRFYELWTLKEAYIKACGLGLAIPLQDFSYSFNTENTLSIDFEESRGDEPQSWQFWQLDAGQDYKLALALKNTEGSTEIQKIQSWIIRDTDSVSELATSVIRTNF